MRENASSQAETAIPKRRSVLPILVFVVTMFLFASITGSYFAYKTFFKEPEVEEIPSVLSANNIDAQDWQRFTYDMAQLSFEYPSEFTAVEVEGGLSIYENAKEVLVIKQGNIGEESFQEYTQSNHTSTPELITQNSKMGFRYSENGVETIYYPLQFGKFISLQFSNASVETQQKINRMIGSIEFTAPVASTNP